MKISNKRISTSDKILDAAEGPASNWGVDFMVGLMCNTFAAVDRIRGLSGGLCSTERIEKACLPHGELHRGGIVGHGEERTVRFH